MSTQQPRQRAGRKSEGPARPERIRRSSASKLPEIAPGTFDAAALLASVTAALRPVLEAQLEQIAASLASSAATAEETSPTAAIRAELTRRLVPQFTEAVRGAVMEGIRTRQMHLAQLAVIDRAAYQASNLTSLQSRIDHEIAKAGLVRVTEPADLSLFSLTDPVQEHAESNGIPHFSVVSPAYTDRESGRLVETGWLRAENGHRPEELPLSLTPRQKRQQRSKGELAQKRRPTPAKAQAAPKKPHRKGQPKSPAALPPVAEKSASGSAPAPNGPGEDRTPDGPRGAGSRHASHRGVAGNQRTGRQRKGTR
ncbi:hypothetical protein ACFCX4_08365 [Kitasatospora sp. NPDC056327]|uniref:hypothetical protein n=1 Tax=Kitasatospora sp. NPDC056327 TaxID=3345785 RepID=UPI0035DFDED1